ncbi:hypothetical protein ACJX0J_030545, partial [Zea mays]
AAVDYAIMVKLSFVMYTAQQHIVFDRELGIPFVNAKKYHLLLLINFIFWWYGILNPLYNGHILKERNFKLMFNFDKFEYVICIMQLIHVVSELDSIVWYISLLQKLIEGFQISLPYLILILRYATNVLQFSCFIHKLFS